MEAMYLKKRGTNMTFTWTPVLSKRDDMIPISKEEMEACILAQKDEARQRVSKKIQEQVAGKTVTEVSLAEMDETALRARARELKVYLKRSDTVVEIRSKIAGALKLKAEAEEGPKTPSVGVE